MTKKEAFEHELKVKSAVQTMLWKTAVRACTAKAARTRTKSRAHFELLSKRNPGMACELIALLTKACDHVQQLKEQATAQ